MDDNSPLNVLRTRIRQRMNDMADHMAGGGCLRESSDTTAVEYARCCGEIKAYAEVEADLLEIASQLEPDEDK